MRTFVWRAPRVDPAELTDGLAQIYNTGDGQVEVLEVLAETPSGMVNGTQQGTYALVRITALTQGMGSLVTAVAPDTAAGTLPAQVQFVEEPDSFVQTDTLRQVSDCPTFSATAALGAFGALQTLQLGPHISSSHRMRSGRAGGAVEPIVLREGEGLAYTQTASGVPHAGAVRFRVRVVGTSRTYIFRGKNVGTVIPGKALCALMNNTGSGVVLEVNAVSEFEDGTATLPSLRLALTDGYFEGYGEPSVGTATPMDTQASNALPSTVKLIQGPFLARLAGDSRGVPYEWYRTHGTGGFSVANQQQAGSLRGVVRVPRPNTPGATTTISKDHGVTLFKAMSGSGIVLGRGEGLSVLLGRGGTIETSSYAFYNIRFVFGYTPRATMHPLRGTVVSAS